MKNLYSFFSTFFIVLFLGCNFHTAYAQQDKQVYPQGVCEEKFTKRSELLLTYTIRFQNTGNAPAINVNIIDSLSNLLDRSSLNVVGSSHPMVVDTTSNDNVINFKFDNIMLPDSLSSPELSQGFVIFEINEATGNPSSALIQNKSYIYFDTNAPIITNTVKNTVLDVVPLCDPPNPNPSIADCEVPTNLNAESLDATTVRLSWSVPPNNNAINYEILRNNQPIATVALTQSFFIDSFLSPNTRYVYSIRSICGNSEEVSQAAVITTIPATPILVSIEAPCQGESGVIRVNSQGAVYRVYDSETSATPILETNNATIETPTLSDTTTFYISVVINDIESERLEVVVPVKESFEAVIEQGAVVETCENEFVLSAQEVDGATYIWLRENIEIGRGQSITTTFEARYKLRVLKEGCFAESEFTTTRFVETPTASIAQGSSVIFCDFGTLEAQNTSASVTYEWILNGNVIGSGTSISVSESGTYKLKASLPACSDSTEISVTVVPSPTNFRLEAEELQICEGTETTLSATQGNGFTYEWFRNGDAISNTADTISTSEIGTYFVEITTSEGCKARTNEVTLSRLIPAPAFLRVNTVNGTPTNIDIATEGEIELVTWFRDGIELPAFTNQTLILPTENGNYKAFITYETGCTIETEEKNFISPVLGVEDESDRVFKVYPNPNTGTFHIELIQVALENSQISIIDALGRTVYAQNLSKQEKSHTINLPEVSSGLYVIQIISDGKLYTKQLVIE